MKARLWSGIALFAPDITLLEQPLSHVSGASPGDVRFTLDAPEGALTFHRARVADTISGTAVLPSPAALQQGASSMTWRVVRRTPPAPHVRRPHRRCTCCVRLVGVAARGRCAESGTVGVEPAAPSAERLTRALREGGNVDVTTRIYPRANRVVRLVTSPLAPAGSHWEWPKPAPGYLQEVIRWTRENQLNNCGVELG